MKNLYKISIAILFVFINGESLALPNPASEYCIQQVVKRSV